MSLMGYAKPDVLTGLTHYPEKLTTLLFIRELANLMYRADSRLIHGRTKLYCPCTVLVFSDILFIYVFTLLYYYVIYHFNRANPAKHPSLRILLCLPIPTPSAIAREAATGKKRHQR